MNGPSRRVTILAVLAALAGTAQAAVNVTFTEPERYTDVGWQLNSVRDVTEELAMHLQRLGEKHLAPGQALTIEVLDIDLAGEMRFRPRAGYDVRILRGGVDWPRFRLRYSVETAGQRSEVREETISDRNYLMRSLGRSESLAYEKRLLDDWFRERFGERKR